MFPTWWTKPPACSNIMTELVLLGQNVSDLVNETSWVFKHYDWNAYFFLVSKLKWLGCQTSWVKSLPLLSVEDDATWDANRHEENKLTPQTRLRTSRLEARVCGQLPWTKFKLGCRTSLHLGVDTRQELGLYEPRVPSIWALFVWWDWEVEESMSC